jgi:hypothetical protein
MAEIVYVFTNPEMPGRVKIRRTDREDVSKRAKELFTTGVPVPFDCAYACEVSDNEEACKALHERFAKHRIYPKREFFRITARTAIKALKEYELKDVTPEVRADSDSKIPDEKKNARWEARQKAVKENPEYAKGKDMHQNIRKTNDK